MSLLLDGLTGILQDRLRSDHSVIAHHMMYAVNVFAAVYLSVGVVVTGELWRVMAFIQRHPTVIFNISVFTVSSAIGQVNHIIQSAQCNGVIVVVFHAELYISHYH